MTPAAIDEEIEVYIVSTMTETQYSDIDEYTFYGIPLENEPQPESDYWVQFKVSLLDTDLVEIGDKDSGAIGIRHGNLHINTYSPKENGKRQGAIYAGLLEVSFRRHETTNIQFLEPTTKFSVDGSWLNHHTVIPFYTTIGE